MKVLHHYGFTLISVESSKEHDSNRVSNIYSSEKERKLHLISKSCDTQTGEGDPATGLPTLAAISGKNADEK